MAGTGARKLELLAGAARYDASCASTQTARAPAAAPGICHSYTPDGRCVSLLKILLTNYCIYDCAFCVNRVSNDIPRARFEPDEVVNLTLEFYRRNYIDGLFLSSGVIRSVDYTMEQLVAVARLLRERHAFEGYIHLKAMPGASPELLGQAGRYADRLSANIELPTAHDLRRLAPDKRWAGIDSTMGAIRAHIADAESTKRPELAFAPAGQTTQMIVGATEASDADILNTASDLYTRHRLRRVYYTAYSPIPGQETLLASKPTPLAREHRLYQADRLVRDYGFASGELFEGGGTNLDLRVDPKLAWALRHPEVFPVDVNAAPLPLLLRVPGIGRKTARRIVQCRRQTRLGAAELRRIGLALRLARHFIIAAGMRPPTSAERLSTDVFASSGCQLPLPLYG